MVGTYPAGARRTAQTKSQAITTNANRTSVTVTFGGGGAAAAS